jgi:Flp pilus assembly protein TadG
MMRNLATLLREQSGSVIVELALVAPLLAAMLIGLIDLSTAYSDKLKLEQVAQRAVEKVMQNSFKTGDETTLETEARAEAGTGATADLTYWLECDGEKMTGTSAYTTGCADGEQYGRYVQIVVEKKYTPLIMQVFANSNADGTLTVDGTAGIRIQ